MADKIIIRAYPHDDASPEAIAARQVRIMLALENMAVGLAASGALSEEDAQEVVSPLTAESVEIDPDEQPDDGEEPAPDESTDRL